MHTFILCIYAAVFVVMYSNEYMSRGEMLTNFQCLPSVRMGPERTETPFRSFQDDPTRGKTSPSIRFN